MNLFCCTVNARPLSAVRPDPRNGALVDPLEIKEADLRALQQLGWIEPKELEEILDLQIDRRLAERRAKDQRALEGALAPDAPVSAGLAAQAAGEPPIDE